MQPSLTVRLRPALVFGSRPESAHLTTSPSSAPPPEALRKVVLAGNLSRRDRLFSALPALVMCRVYVSGAPAIAGPVMVFARRRAIGDARCAAAPTAALTKLVKYARL